MNKIITEIKAKVNEQEKLRNNIKELEQLIYSHGLSKIDIENIENEIKQYKLKVDQNDNNNLDDTISLISKFDLTSNQLTHSEVDFIIPSMIVSNEITMLAAAPSTGKSILALVISKMCLDYNTINQVIYCDLDNSISTLKTRNLGEIKNKFGKVFLYLHGTNVNNTTMHSILYKLKCTNLENTLIIFDSAKNFLRSGADRDKNKDVSPLMNIMKSLRNNGATVIYLHHTNKPQRDIQTSFAGSSAWLEDCSNAFLLVKNDYKKTLNLEVIKNRIGIINNLSISIDESLNYFNYVDINIAKETKEEEYIRIEIANYIKSCELDCTYTMIINDMKSKGINRDKTNKIIQKWKNIFWSTIKQKKAHNRDIFSCIDSSDKLDKCKVFNTSKKGK